MHRLMRVIAIISLVVLAGCSTDVREAEAAERRYTLLEQAGGKPDELCQAMRDVADAWLKAEDEVKYKDWALRRDIGCRRAEQLGRL
jgi:hypothetical protein